MFYYIQMNNLIQRQIVDLILRSNNILVLPSAPADGDSLGSAIALYLALKKIGKEVTVISSEKIPEVLQFLPNIKVISNQIASGGDFIITLDCKDIQIDNIKSSVEADKINIVVTPKNGKFLEQYVSFNRTGSNYDLIITVDTAELTQLKSFYDNNTELFHEVPVVNIDHHISNSHFGKLNYVDIMAASATELLLPLLEELADRTGTELIDEDVATLLLTGIITDTGSFQNANTTPRSFAKAAQLISYGARQQEIIQHIYKTKQLSQLKLWGRVLSKLQTDEHFRMVWSVVSQQDFKDTESSEEQTGDIIDELMTNAPGAEVILLIKEKSDGTVSVSLRSTNSSIDVSKIAEQFGGGGHVQAAGCRLVGMNLRDAEYKIIETVKDFQAERLGFKAERSEGSPMIDVEELMKRADEAQKVSEMITPEVKKAPKKEKVKAVKKASFNLKTKPPVEENESEEPTLEGEVLYKFED